MLQNTLSTTLNYGGSCAPSFTMIGSAESGAMQEVEAAGRMLDKHLNYDSNFPSLLDTLKITQVCPSVSGLSEGDYPNGTSDSRVLRHLHTLSKVPLPADLLHHFQHMQCNCMMGLFPEIKRAWLTIDSDIYVWMYQDGSDLAYFDGLHDTILSVGLVKPKKGVFKPYIEYLLCLATPTEIVLLGVSFSNQETSNSCMHLLPEPLFSVTADAAYILTIKGTDNGRIFMGDKDGSLWELVYQAEDGWFSRKCRKVNHSKSTISYILPTFLTLTEDDPVTQVEIDNSRSIVYTLTEKGNISLYDLGSDGSSTVKVMTLYHNNIVNMAVQVAKTVDKSNFKNLVSICAISASESPHIHLLAVTGTGIRLYYTTTTLTNPTIRPFQLVLLHIRLPPGFAANALTHRPTKVHKALYSHGTCILCASESNESDVIWSVSVDQYPFHPTLAESQAVLAVDGFVWALADVTPKLWCSALCPPTTLGTRPPLLVTQHQSAAKQLVLLSAAGAHILTALRPVDQLRHLLVECGSGEGNSIRDYFSAMSPTQACATALILALEQNIQDTQVAEWARDAIFRHGTVASNVTSTLNQGIASPANFAFQPTQMSTPIPSQMPQNVVSNQTSSEPQFSPLHNSLYLYLARVLRPVWGTALIKEVINEGKKMLTSVISSEEVSFLARHVELLSNFMHVNQGPGQSSAFVSAQQSALSGHDLSMRDYSGSSVALNERTSLLALKALLARCLEALRLWTILTTHNFTLVAEKLNTDVKDHLKNLTLRELTTSGSELCRHLIMALMDRYHGDNASIDAISGRLRDLCPTLYRIEDAKLCKANEIILAAKNNNNKSEKEKAFREAVDLCKQIGACVNVSGICSQLAGGNWYEGVVDLCLSVAQQRDPNNQAIRYYNNNEPNDDQQGYMAFTARMDCYRVMLDHLNQLVGTTTVPSPTASPSVPNKPGPPAPPQQDILSSDANQYAEQMIALVVSSSDELGHVTLYQWLVDSNRTEGLLAITSSYIESFLTRPYGHGPLNHLLWRYYERNKEYYKAAKTLALLADEISECELSKRVVYLSRALMCLSSSQMSTATSYADFMLHLEEKKDVARVQLMVLDALESRGVGADVISSLNSSLLDITALYEKFAEPYNLWECKLAIVHCAGHSEPQLIQTLWTHIINEELEKSINMSLVNRIDSLASKIKTLARSYMTSANFFPLEHIIKICEVHSVRLKTEDTAWVVNALKSCGIPVNKLIAIYHRLYSSGESVWEVERSPYHLLRILSHLFDLLTDEAGIISAQERRATREQCLDFVAAYLTDLGASAEPSAAIIASHLKTNQVKLERN